MSQQIKSKSLKRGHKHEAKWPSEFGTLKEGRYHWDPETKTFKPGSKPTNIKKYSKAPMVLNDSIEPFKHPRSGELITSKSQLKKVDKACGTVTTRERPPPAPQDLREKLKKERAKDRRASLEKAVAAIDNGMAPLSEETRAICAEENERISQKLGFDAFNIVGRKNDKRGKRFKR